MSLFHFTINCHGLSTRPLVSLVGVAVLTSCAVATPTQTKPITTSPTEPETVHFVGRVERLEAQHARYAWSGAGVVARFRGTGVAIRLKDDKNEHQVVLDGKPLERLVTRTGNERYPVAESLTPGLHQLELYRRTEPLFGPTEFLGLEIAGGGLVRYEPTPTRHVELVGDSISCGYGNEGKSVSCPFSADTENHYLSYGALLARSVNAELSTIAWSGRGIVKNYNGGAGDYMGLLYERVLPESASSRWDAGVTYDAVVVNLGTNDFSTDPDPSEASFADAYARLLEQIRRNSPKAFILCTIGPMLGDEDLARARAAIDQAVARRRAAGDERVVQYRMQAKNESPGCDWHPSLATHQRMAEELTRELKAALDW